MSIKIVVQIYKLFKPSSVNGCRYTLRIVLSHKHNRIDIHIIRYNTSINDFY